MNREELLKVAKPINMKTWEVQAILDERKSATRRVVKPQLPSNIIEIYRVDPLGYLTYKVDERYLGGYRNCRTPYKVGDILYVRETWSRDYANTEKILYKADYKTYDIKGLFKGVKWHPSIHMPKEAARVFLKVKDVRVERLQDIKINDLVKEGLGNISHPIDKPWYKVAYEKIKQILKCNDDDWFWVIEFERMEIENE